MKLVLGKIVWETLHQLYKPTNCTITTSEKQAKPVAGEKRCNRSLWLQSAVMNALYGHALCRLLLGCWALGVGRCLLLPFRVFVVGS